MKLKEFIINEYMTERELKKYEELKTVEAQKFLQKKIQQFLTENSQTDFNKENEKYLRSLRIKNLQVEQK